MNTLKRKKKTTRAETALESLELPTLRELSYLDITNALEATPNDVVLIQQKEAMEQDFSQQIATASGAKMVQQFSAISTLIHESRNLDLLLENVIYFLTNCESNTIREYRDYLISENRSYEQVKTLELLSKKQIFKMLCDHVRAEITAQCDGINFFDKGHLTALLKPINLIIDNYEWIIDLYFNDSIDQPKHRLELIKQIARVSTIDNKSKELKVYKLDYFKSSGLKKPVLSNSEIKALNKQKSIRGGGTYATFSAQSLATHIKEVLDVEVGLLKKEEEEVKKAQIIQAGIESRKRIQAELIKDLKDGKITIEALPTEEA